MNLLQYFSFFDNFIPFNVIYFFFNGFLLGIGLYGMKSKENYKPTVGL